MNSEKTTNVMNVNEMTREQRRILEFELTQRRMDDFREELEAHKDEIRKNSEAINEIIETTKKQGKDIKILKESTEVLCAPVHKARKESFHKLCKARVWKLFNNNATSCEYAAFSPYLSKKIYSDIANKFSVDSWINLSMENWEEPGSIYNMAREYASNWTPSDYYVKEKLGELIGRRDNGVLEASRCRALTGYLKSTNNGEINPFAA